MPQPAFVRRDLSCALCLFSAMSLMMVTDLHAGIALVSQDRFVDVTTSGVPGFGSPPMDQRFTAPDFSPFNQSAQLSFPSMAIAQTASQNSTIVLSSDGTGLSIDATGSLSHNISFNSLNATTHFQASFTLTQPEPYVLSYNGQTGDPRPTSPKQFVPGMFTGPSAPGSLAGDPHTINFFTILTYSGTLQPGSYELLADINTIGFGSFDTHLAVGTAVVPLPPALWQTLLWLPAIGLLMLIARGRRRVL